MSAILVIEDDETMNGFLVLLLSNTGYQVTGVSDADEGLKLFQTHPFDLVITDIVMPNKDGIETILFIRKHDKKIPIIAISGGGRIAPDKYLIIAQGLGADYAFEKPLDKEAFLGAVRECLS